MPHATDLWIAQISDPHLRPTGQLYQDVVDTAPLLRGAIAQLNALPRQPDIVLLTGDVVDEGDPAEYAVARRILADLRAPLLVIPGNHDEREAFRAAFNDHAYLPPQGPLNYVFDLPPLRLIGFDVTLPGLHHGAIGADQLAWLASILSADPARPTIIMMHQPPLECGVPYLDEYRCFDGEKLAALVARFPAVERVLCGHVHRQMTMRFGGTLLCTAPSTATAIALQPWPEAAPASSLEPPGLLLHHWRAGQEMITHSLPIGTFPGPFPFA